jgi:hypothetical protein
MTLVLVDHLMMAHEHRLVGDDGALPIPALAGVSPRATQSFHLASGRPLPGVPASANLVTLTFSKADASTYKTAADALRQREEEAAAAEAVERLADDARVRAYEVLGDRPRAVAIMERRLSADWTQAMGDVPG